MDFKQFYKTINFDIDNEIRTVFQATQGDTKSRGLLVDLIVGGVKTPVTTEKMTFYALKPDGTRVMTVGVKEGTGFRIDFTNQTFAVPGVLLCTLVLSGTNGERIADRKFKMTVDSSLEDGAIISKDERGILDRAFDLATDLVPQLEVLEETENKRVLAELKREELYNQLNDSVLRVKKTPIIESSYFNYLDGKVYYENPNTNRTTYIEVKLGDIVHVIAGGNIVFYDENLKFINGFDYLGSDLHHEIVRTNVKYIGITFLKANSEIFKVWKNNDKFEINDNALVMDEGFGIKRVTKGYNLFDRDNIQTGYYYHYLTGERVNLAIKNSGMIPVEPNTVLRKNFTGQLVFFDKDLKFIHGLDLQSIEIVFDVPPNGAFLNCSFSNRADVNSLKVEFMGGKTDVFKATEKLILDEVDVIRNKATFEINDFLKMPTPYNDGYNWEGSQNQATHPSIVTFDSPWNGYKYWMAYTPYPSANDTKENPSLAVSNDGIKWITPSGVTNPLEEAPTDGYNSDTHLFFNSSTQRLEMWFRVVTGGKTTETLKRKTSSDGKAWTATEIMFSISKPLVLQLISPSLIFESGKYRLWVMRDWYIHLLESEDGKSWIDKGRVKENGEDIHSWHPNIQKRGNFYYLLNCDKDTTFGVGGVLKFSTSIDGINWEKQKDILTFTGNPWNYNGYGVYRGSMIMETDFIQFVFGMYKERPNKSQIWTLGSLRGKDIDSLHIVDKNAFDYYSV